MKKIYLFTIFCLLQISIENSLISSNAPDEINQSRSENQSISISQEINNEDNIDEIMERYILRTQQQEPMLFIEAFHTGMTRGYQYGHTQGYSQGKSNGYKKGQQEGFQEGFADGIRAPLRDETESTLTNIVSPLFAGIGVGIAMASLHCTIS